MLYFKLKCIKLFVCYDSCTYFMLLSMITMINMIIMVCLITVIDVIVMIGMKIKIVCKSLMVDLNLDAYLHILNSSSQF